MDGLLRVMLALIIKLLLVTMGNRVIDSLRIARVNSGNET